MTTDDIEWGDPPPRRWDGFGSHARKAEKLQEKPGEWAIVGRYLQATTASATANTVRKGSTRAWLPAGAYEAFARTVGKEHRVYARYVGPSGEYAGDE